MNNFKKVQVYVFLFALFATILNGCKKDEVASENGVSSKLKSTSSWTIGTSYQGGVIAYILQSGDPGFDASIQHGIIAATNDQSTGIKWSNSEIPKTTGAIATALGTGNVNTNIIVSSLGGGSYAAKLCYDLVLNGYSDWYLPSKDELNKLYLNKASIGGFASYYYWSSSESNIYLAWGQDFRYGSQGISTKYSSSTDYKVRAIRAF